MAEQKEKLADIGEDALVKSLVKGLAAGSDVVVGAGDDCAVIRGGRTSVLRMVTHPCRRWAGLSPLITTRV